MVKYKSKDVGRSERVKNTKSAGINECDCHDMLSACLAMTERGKGSITEIQGTVLRTTFVIGIDVKGLPFDIFCIQLSIHFFGFIFNFANLFLTY